MDIGLSSYSPSGIGYMPSSPPPEHSGIQCLSDDIYAASLQERVSEEGRGKILTAIKRSNYMEYLRNPSTWHVALR